MGFREGAYATVWEIANRGSNFTKVRLSTSRKNKDTDEYVTDFSGFVSFLGDANKCAGLIEQALSRSNMCRIRIGDCDVTNTYDKEARREYTNFTIFSFEIPDNRSDAGSGSSQKARGENSTAARGKSGNSQSQAPVYDSDDDDDLPF